MTGQATLIRGAAPYGEEPQDLLLADGIILATGSDAAADSRAADAEIVDGAGLVVLPGLVDLHTHLREPGREDAETVESGSAARLSAAASDPVARMIPSASSRSCGSSP